MDGGTPFNIAAFVEDVLTGSVSSDPLQLTSPSQSLVTHQTQAQQPSSSSYTQPQPTQNQMHLHRQADAVHPGQQHAGTPYQGQNINAAQPEHHFGTQSGGRLSAANSYPQVQGPAAAHPPSHNPSTIHPPNMTGALSAAQPVLKRAWDQTQTLVSSQLAEIHAQYQGQLDEGRAHATAQIRHAMNMASARIEESERERKRLAVLADEAQRVNEGLKLEMGVLVGERGGWGEQVRQLRAWLAHAQRENLILKTGVEVLRDAKEKAEQGMREAQMEGEQVRGENVRLENKVKELEERMERMEDEWRVSESIRLKLHSENKRLARDLKEAVETFEGTLEYPDLEYPSSSLPQQPPSATPEEALFEDPRLEEQHGDALEHIDSPDLPDPPHSQATAATAVPVAAKDALGEAQKLEDQDTVEGHGPLEYPESADPYLPLLRRFSNGRTPCPAGALDAQPEPDAPSQEGRIKIIKVEEDEDEPALPCPPFGRQTRMGV